MANDMIRTAVITGSSGGIGKATALCFLKAGWNVALLARSQNKLAAMAHGQARALPLVCDVSQEQEVEQAFDAAVDRFGRVDFLFNNAGNNVAPAAIDRISLDDWRNVLDVNLTGAFLCARAAFGRMRVQSPQGGRIVNNGSISAHTPRPGSVPYTTTKHAITGLTKTLALDGRELGITCGQIDIGNAATDMTQAMERGVLQPDGRLMPEATMDVQHVADAVLHMASLPRDANVLSMTVMANKMPFVGRG
jgi:NAD(P)-dependent dehydrogenase (short-subunit alcohol dehydrogenase family)